MTPGLPPLRRASALVALPPLLAVALAGLASIAADHAATDAAAARRALAAARAQLAPQNGTAALAAAPARLLVQGATAGVSGAAFQSLLAEMAALSGATLERVDPVLAEPAGALTQMHSRATFSGTDSDIMNLVINLEAAEPLILLDRVELTPLGEDGATLRADLDLSAFAAAGGAP